jgi:hypothetical protein
LFQSLGDLVAPGGPIGSLPNSARYLLTRPKEINLFQLIRLIRAHEAVEWADFDGYLQIVMATQAARNSGEVEVLGTD